MKKLTSYCIAPILVAPFISLSVALQANASEQYPVKGEISLGLLFNEGNTESSSLRSGFKIGQDREKWRFALDFKSLTESSSTEDAGKEKTAERYRLEAKVDYKFSEFNYAFLYTSYDDDRFTAFDYQASAAAGYGRRLINNEKYQWDVEIGPGYRVSQVADTEETLLATDEDGAPTGGEFTVTTEGEKEEDAIIRLATKFDWKISETSSFLQAVNVEAGEDNTYSQSETALKVMMNSKLSLKLAYFIKYNEEVPADSEHADRETSVSLLYSF